jgi:hypothetical protein
MSDDEFRGFRNPLLIVSDDEGNLIDCSGLERKWRALSAQPRPAGRMELLEHPTTEPGLEDYDARCTRCGGGPCDDETAATFIWSGGDHWNHWCRADPDQAAVELRPSKWPPLCVPERAGRAADTAPGLER